MPHIVDVIDQLPDTLIGIFSPYFPTLTHCIVKNKSGKIQQFFNFVSHFRHTFFQK